MSTHKQLYDYHCFIFWHSGCGLHMEPHLEIVTLESAVVEAVIHMFKHESSSSVRKCCGLLNRKEKNRPISALPVDVRKRRNTSVKRFCTTRCVLTSNGWFLYAISLSSTMQWRAQDYVGPSSCPQFSSVLCIATHHWIRVAVIEFCNSWVLPISLYGGRRARSGTPRLLLAHS